MGNQHTLQRIFNAVSFRDAGNLHNTLRQQGDTVSPQARKQVQEALRAAGMVQKKAV